jgi:hypothetical protein
LKQAEYYNELLWMKLKPDDFPVGENPPWKQGEGNSRPVKVSFWEPLFQLGKNGR